MIQPPIPKKSLRLIWYVFLASILLYLLYIRLGLIQAGPPNPSLDIPILVIAVLLVAGSFSIKRILARATAREGLADIVAFAQCEAAGTLGLIVYAVSGSKMAFVLFGLGIAGLLFHYPKQ